MWERELREEKEGWKGMFHEAEGGMTSGGGREGRWC